MMGLEKTVLFISGEVGKMIFLSQTFDFSQMFK